MKIIRIKTNRIFNICVLILVLIFTYSCNNINKEYVENIADETSLNYVLNTNSMKVHIPKCESARRISDKNRKNVNDKLSNIISQGYSICHNCNAGLKKNDIIQSIKDELFYKNLLIEPPKNLPTYEEYLDAISIIGKWYVNNIPTNLTSLQEEDLKEYTGDKKHIKTYKLKNRYGSKKETIKDYNVLSDVGNNLDNYDITTKILRANENAVNYYMNNYSDIDFRKSFAFYPCVYLDKSVDDYKKAGDDCVRFIFSVLNCMDNRYTKMINDYSKVKWTKINTESLVIKKANILYAMNQVGFNIFDTNSYAIDINGDNLIDVECEKINSDFKLIDGDIIVTKGHVHLFLGNNNDTIIDFGWGKVNRSYPQISDKPTIISKGDNYVISFRGNDYTRVYRYVGNR